MKTKKKLEPRKKIQVLAPNHTYVSVDLFEGNIVEVIERLKKFIPEHKEFIKNLKNENGYKKDPQWDLINNYEISITRYYEDIDVEIKYFREETKEEFEKRIEADRKRSIAARQASLKRKKEEEKQEKELYEKLKKKYG